MKQVDAAKRPSWDTYFMELTALVAKRSTCLRRRVGAILVREHRIVATGYNGAPAGVSHCLETGCLREQMGIPSGQRHELCRALHAEQNVIVQAARYGISVADSILYCTNMPCIICAKMIINSGIRKVVYYEPYDDEMTISMMQDAGMELIHYIPQSD